MPLTQHFPGATRTSCLRVFPYKIAIFSVALLFIALLLPSLAGAQGGVPLVTVATDQTALQLPNHFGAPISTAVSQSGDFAFLGIGSSALFFHPATATSASLLLQMGDPVPGIPNSLILSFSPVLLLNSGQTIFFGVTFNLPDGLAHAALLTGTGPTYSIVATSDDIAPGSGGATYGTGLLPGSINDEGDVYFVAVPTGKTATTYYIVPSGGSAVRVVALDDPPPPACTWCFVVNGSVSDVISPPVNSILPPLNASGQVPIVLAGGLFIGSKNGMQLVPLPSTGPCSLPSPATDPPGPYFFPLLGNSVPLNSAGTVVFANSSGAVNSLGPQTGICVSTGGTVAAAVVSAGDAAPAGLGGTYVTLTVNGFDDAGDILFTAQISGGTTTYALLRYHTSSVPAGLTDIVAYNGEVLPAPDGSTFASPIVNRPTTPPTILPVPAFNGISMAKNGLTSFNVLLSPSGEAVYQQSAAASPVRVVLNGQTAPSNGGGTLDFVSIINTQTLNDGATFLSSPISNGSASFGEFLASPSGIVDLMTTGDALPTNARISLTGAPPSAAGNFVAFLGQLPGAGRGLFVSDTSSGTITQVYNDNLIPVPNPLVEPSILMVTPNFFVNDVGQVAFQVAPQRQTVQIGTGLSILPNGVVTDPSLFPEQVCGTVFLWSPAGGLTKVAAPGDAGPVAGTQFSCASLNSGQLSPLNHSGQLTFEGLIFTQSVPPATPSFPGNGVYIYTPGSGISQLAAVNSLLAISTAPVSFVGSIPNPINSSGQVAFSAVTGTGISSTRFLQGSPGFFQGFLLDTPGGAASEVVGVGDPVPGTGNLFDGPYFISGLDDQGDVSFTATTSTAADGLFLAPFGGSIQTIALDGGAAPNGGNFSLVMPVYVPVATVDSHSSFALMNNETDLAFRAGIMGGTADSGYFRLLHSGADSGTLQSVVEQGFQVPRFGPSVGNPASPFGIFNSFPVPGNQGANFALGPDGSLAFTNGFATNGVASQGMFFAQPNRSLFRVLASGDTAPGGGTVNGVAMSQGVAAGGAGQFAFWAGIQGGSARQAILVTAIPAGTAHTLIFGGYARASTVFGAPITFTATVTSSATDNNPTGTVSFFDDGILIGTATLSSGQTTLINSTQPTGTHSLTILYSGDANFSPSTSMPEELGIQARTTATAVASSLNPAVGGQSVTFTATITTTAGGAPTGTVTFFDGATSIGTAVLNGSAVATLSASSLVVASHSITAQYLGDVNSTGSTSSSVAEVMNIAGFGIPPSPLSLQAGQSLNIPLTVFEAPGSNLSFTLSCSGLPVGAACTFGSNPVAAAAPPNGAGVQLTFSTTSGSGIMPGARQRKIFPGLGFGGFTLLVAAMFTAAALYCRRAHREVRWRLATCTCLTTCALAILMVGCGVSSSGSSGVQGTPTGPATFTVTRTSGSTTISVVVNVTVR